MKKVPAWIENKRAMGRELAASKRAAGLSRNATRPDTLAEQGWREQMHQHVRDTRNLTGVLMGDPIKGDPRAPWRG